MRIASACAVALAFYAFGAAGSALRIGAWLTYWDLDRGIERLDALSARSVRDVLLFSAALSPAGDVLLVGDEASTKSAIEKLRSRGSRVWITIVNDVHAEGEGRTVLKDAALVHRILDDRALGRRHREQILSLARTLAVSGVDIDYENLGSDYRESFTELIAGLSTALHREGFLLSVTVQPKVRHTSSAGPGGADWAGLCPHVDRLQVMLYNLHSGATEPGPMATPAWIESVLGFAKGECAAERIVPAVKLAGMDWGPRGARGIHYEDAIALAGRMGAELSREVEGEAPFFRYDSDDGRHTVFFEDARSIARKLEGIRDFGFADVVLWSLGREDPALLARVAP